MVFGIFGKNNNENSKIDIDALLGKHLNIDDKGDNNKKDIVSDIIDLDSIIGSDSLVKLELDENGKVGEKLNNEVEKNQVKIDQIVFTDDDTNINQLDNRENKEDDINNVLEKSEPIIKEEKEEIDDFFNNTFMKNDESKPIENKIEKEDKKTDIIDILDLDKPKKKLKSTKNYKNEIIATIFVALIGTIGYFYQETIISLFKGDNNINSSSTSLISEESNISSTSSKNTEQIIINSDNNIDSMNKEFIVNSHKNYGLLSFFNDITKNSQELLLLNQEYVDYIDLFNLDGTEITIIFNDEIKLNKFKQFLEGYQFNNLEISGNTYSLNIKIN